MAHNTTEQKQPKQYTLGQVVRNMISWGMVYTFAIAAAFFITGWHTHQAHEQSIEARVNAAVSAASKDQAR